MNNLSSGLMEGLNFQLRETSTTSVGNATGSTGMENCVTGEKNSEVEKESSTTIVHQCSSPKTYLNLDNQSQTEGFSQPREFNSSGIGNSYSGPELWFPPSNWMNDSFEAYSQYHPYPASEHRNPEHGYYDRKSFDPPSQRFPNDRRITNYVVHDQSPYVLSRNLSIYNSKLQSQSNRYHPYPRFLGADHWHRNDYQIQPPPHFRYTEEPSGTLMGSSNHLQIPSTQSLPHPNSETRILGNQQPHGSPVKVQLRCQVNNQNTFSPNHAANIPAISLNKAVKNARNSGLDTKQSSVIESSIIAGSESLKNSSMVSSNLTAGTDFQRDVNQDFIEQSSTHNPNMSPMSSLGNEEDVNSASGSSAPNSQTTIAKNVWTYKTRSLASCVLNEFVQYYGNIHHTWSEVFIKELHIPSKETYNSMLQSLPALLATTTAAKTFVGQDNVVTLIYRIADIIKDRYGLPNLSDQMDPNSCTTTWAKEKSRDLPLILKAEILYRIFTQTKFGKEWDNQLAISLTLPDYCFDEYMSTLRNKEKHIQVNNPYRFAKCLDFYNRETFALYCGLLMTIKSKTPDATLSTNHFGISSTAESFSASFKAGEIQWICYSVSQKYETLSYSWLKYLAKKLDRHESTIGSYISKYREHLSPKAASRFIESIAAKEFVRDFFAGVDTIGSDLRKRPIKKKIPNFLGTIGTSPDEISTMKIGISIRKTVGLEKFKLWHQETARYFRRMSTFFRPLLSAEIPTHFFITQVEIDSEENLPEHLHPIKHYICQKISSYDAQTACSRNRKISPDMRRILDKRINKFLEIDENVPKKEKLIIELAEEFGLSHIYVYNRIKSRSQIARSDGYRLDGFVRQ